MGTKTARRVTKGVQGDNAQGRFHIMASDHGSVLARTARTLRNVLYRNLGYWPCFLDRGTETGGTASHMPKVTLHQLFSQGSAAQDSTASEQSLRPVLRLHSSRKDCCFSSEEEWSPWHREPFAPDPTARTQPGRSRVVSAFTALPALASVQVNGVHTAGT